MEYTVKILEQIKQDLIDKREDFYSDKFDIDGDEWKPGIEKCDKEIDVINNLLGLFDVT